MKVSHRVRFKDKDFKKSSYTGTDRWACVEVAHREKVVAVRNTTDPRKTTVRFTEEEWNAFLKGVKNGEFDCPT